MDTCCEARADLLQRAFEVGSDAVHLVNEADAGDLVAISLSPNGFALSLNTFHCTEDDKCSVEDAKAAFYFGGEIDMAGRVDNVNCHIIPFAGNGRRVDGDAALRFFRVEVCLSRTVIDIAHSMRRAGVVKNAFGGCGLPRVDMRDDPNVSNCVDRSRHRALFLAGNKKCQTRQ